MISNTKLKSRIVRKSNPEVKEIISIASKEKSWMPLAQIVSGSTRKHSSLNLSEISEKAKDGVVIVPGKVLSSGVLDKKVSIYALSFSESAKSKLDKAKVTYGKISEYISKNKEKGVQILR